jgi:serine/threonine-protein kinase
MSEHLMGGRYRLQQQLGRGGMATVWRARDTHLDRSAAVKVLDPGWRANPVALERLRREAHSVARLDHQNIVGVYDFDVADSAYLVMELVEGRSVTEMLALRDRLPVEQAVSIAAQVCDALGAAHEAGIVHRDIKPSNILVGPTGMVKICDFGVALLQEAAYHSALTGIGTVVGTCQYMAPEQAAGEPLDGRSDLYAVGCVLYTMLVGAPPFNGPSPIEVLDLHLNEPPVPLRAHRDDIPYALDRLVGELLAKDAADRPATAWSVRDRLAEIAGPAMPKPSPMEAPTTTLPVALTSDDRTMVVGRHRAMLAAVPIVSWLRERLSGWVLVLIAAAVVTVGLAAVVLAVSGSPDTSTSEPLSAPTATQDPVEVPDPDLTSSPEPSEPATTPSPAISAAASPIRARPIDQIASLATILQQQAQAGNLQRKAARTLLRDLSEVARLLDAGETAQAAERFGEFRDRVTELRKDGKLTKAGANALPDLGSIAKSLQAG